MFDWCKRLVQIIKSTEMGKVQMREFFFYSTKKSSRKWKNDNILPEVNSIFRQDGDSYGPCHQGRDHALYFVENVQYTCTLPPSISTAYSNVAKYLQSANPDHVYCTDDISQWVDYAKFIRSPLT